MQFTTPIPITIFDHPIGYESSIVGLGSCFATHIGEKLDCFKFRNLTNPFGILFSPAALEKAISFAADEKAFSETDVFYHNERWHSYDAHSDLSSATSAEIVQKLNTAAKTLRAAITNASHIIITLGTAWVYRHNESGAIVANCHKVPQAQFTKELLSVEQTTESLQNIIASIRSINRSTTILFTVSPVRHVKDGFIQNQLSKAHLITALHNVLGAGNDRVCYFPSYEIMMDELRDYRFYAPDMLHPNQVAIDYIWERFTKSNITLQARAIMQEVDSIRKGLAHRPFNPDADAHQKFLQALRQKAEALSQQHPHITF